jgi:hypothetical protein
MEISDFEPIKGCKHPLIASGATPFGSTDRAPDDVLRRRKRHSDLSFQEDDETRQ